MQLTPSMLKVPLSGAACALVAGLLMGGAMRPKLITDDDRPAGPQMIADWAGARSTGPFDPGTTFASFQGQTPDYVLGTDWKRSMTWPQERAAVSARAETVVDDEPAPEPPPPRLSRAVYDEPPPPRPGYPSLGGARSASDLAVDDDVVDADPDATG